MAGKTKSLGGSIRNTEESLIVLKKSVEPQRIAKKVKEAGERERERPKWRC